MLLVFWLTFGVVGSTLSDLFAAGISLVTNLADEALTRLDVAPMLHALIIDGIFAGVGSVLGFMPTIVTPVSYTHLDVYKRQGYIKTVYKFPIRWYLVIRGETPCASVPNVPLRCTV